MNGREKAATQQETHQMTSESSAGQLPPSEQFQNAAMLGQAQAQERPLLPRQVSLPQIALLQQMNMSQPRALLDRAHPPSYSPSSLASSHQNFVPSIQGRTSLQGLPEVIEAQAMINNASALFARSMPQTNQSRLSTEDPVAIHQAKIELTRLNGDIANFEEQLDILRRMKELKKQQSQLTGVSSPRGISPCSV